METGERKKLAFIFAQETTKHFMTLATGVVALSMTFTKDISASMISDVNIRAWVIASWISFVLSIFFGQWTLMALTGTLWQKANNQNNNTFGLNIRIPSMIQVISFMLGIVFTLIIAVKAYALK